MLSSNLTLNNTTNFLYLNFLRLKYERNVDMDRLTQLKFNPFDIDNKILNNQHSERFDDLTCNYHVKNNTNYKILIYPEP
jgi:beta-N-acetylglucosaminidase